MWLRPTMSRPHVMVQSTKNRRLTNTTRLLHSRLQIAPWESDNLILHMLKPARGHTHRQAARRQKTCQCECQYQCQCLSRVPRSLGLSGELQCLSQRRLPTHPRWPGSF